MKSVQQVRDIMDEISAASDEQSRGITQVGVAVSELDRVTQQNAALVQESSSAAALLEEQARRLNEAVAVFQLHVAAASTVTPLKKLAISAKREKPLLLAAEAEENWQSF
nr:hypothetical protein [Pantoea sp.]